MKMSLFSKMPEKLTDTKDVYAKMYIIFSFITLLALGISIFISHGETIDNIFFASLQDTGMDFFNSVASASGFRDYTRGPSAQYPPLAVLFYWIILWSSPIRNAPYDSINGNMGRIKAADLRLFQATLLFFLLITIVTLLVIVNLSGHILADLKYGTFLATVAISSWGCLYAIERGNIILQAYMFLVGFLAFYRSKKKTVRELAYVSLALSAGIKLYPMTFVLLLATEKKWKETFRAFFYCMLSIFGPFIVRGGLIGIQGYIKGVWSWGSYVFTNIIDLMPVLLRIIAVPIILVFGALLIRTLFGEQCIWKRIYILGCISIMGSGNLFYDYSYIMLIPALLFFVAEREHQKADIIYFLLLCIINLPLPILNQDDVPVNTIHSFILAGVMIFTLFMIIVQNTCRYLYGKIMLQKKM